MQSMMGHEVRTDTGKRIIAKSGLWVVFTLMLLTLAAILLMPAQVFAGQQVVQKVDVSNLPDCAQIVIRSSGPLSINPEQVGKYLVFDLYGSLANGQTKSVKVNSGGINLVKCGWYQSKPPVVRVAIGTTGIRKYTITRENGSRRNIIKVFKNNASSNRVVNAAPKVNAFSALSAPIAEPRSTISGSIVDVQPVEIASAIPIKLPDLHVVNVEPVGLAVPRMLVAAAEPMMIGDASLAIAQHNILAASKTVSLDFVSTEIHDVLKALAVQSGVNIVASPDVKGSITVSLNRVTVEDALRLVSQLSGYKFAESNGAFVVGTEANIEALGTSGVVASSDTNTGVVIIKYSDTTVLEKLIQKQFPSVKTSMALSNKDSGLKSIGTLILTGSAFDVQGAKTLVEQIESSMATSVETEVTDICEVKYVDVNELSTALVSVIPSIKISLGPTQGFQLKRPDPEQMGDETSTTSTTEAKKALPKFIMLQGTKTDVDRAKKIIAELDTQLPQIIIEAKVVDISNGGTKNLGIDWSWDKFQVGETNRTAGLTVYDDNGAVTDFKKPSVSPITFGTFHRTPVELLANINALVTSGNGKVLANPNILALDGKPASIFIGNQVKYVSRIDKSQLGTTVSTETAKDGIQLNAISVISSDGYITMNLHPEVSVITNWRPFPEAGVSLPEISRRYVESTVRVKDGETIVIGGLIKDNEIHNVTGLPLLKDLPIVGQFFRSDSKTKTHSEVMMFITPRIVKSN